MPDPPAALKAGLSILMHSSFFMQVYLYNYIFHTFRSKEVNKTPPERGGNRADH